MLDVKTFFNSVAANWDSGEKHTKPELLSSVRLADVKFGERILDLGCGTGIISGLLVEQGASIVAMDVSDAMLAIARKKHAGKKIEFVCGDFYTSDLHGFDKVVVFNAYPHFMDVKAFSQKCHEVLLPHGKVFIIHNMGREKLAEHHKNLTEISRELLPAKEEAKIFLPKFEIIDAKDGDDYYFIAAQKKD